MTDGADVGDRLLVVLPTFNERDNIGGIVPAIRSNLPEAVVWIVDDSSPDGTGQIADDLAARDSQVRVFHRPGKLGLGTAYAEAFRRALGEQFDVVFQMDADFSHGPEYLPVLRGALTDCDMVIGSRYTPGGGTRNWSWPRRVISRGGNMVARVGLGLRTRDATGGFRAYKRSALERLRLDDLHLRGYGYQIEVVYQAEQIGLRVCEVPITFVERVSGQSKMSKAIVLEAVTYILRRRLQRVRRQSRAEPAKDALTERQ